MKTLLFTLFLTILSTISLNAFGQTALSQKTEQEVKDMLCHKWQPILVEENGKTIPMEKEDSMIYIIFLKDGTFIDYFEGNSPSNKWVYNHKAKSITTAHEAKKIVHINEKELVLMYKIDGISSIITLRRVD